MQILDRLNTTAQNTSVYVHMSLTPECQIKEMEKRAE